MVPRGWGGDNTHLVEVYQRGGIAIASGHKISLSD